MTPPEQLRHAAALLERASQTRDRAEAMRLLSEVRAVAQRAVEEVDAVLSPPIEQLSRMLRTTDF